MYGNKGSWRITQEMPSGLLTSDLLLMAEQNTLSLFTTCEWCNWIYFFDSISFL